MSDTEINKKDVFDRFKNVFCVQMVIQERFELPTHGLEGRCSIQLSYWTVCRCWSEQQDSNLRPPGPKPGALPN